MAEVADRYARAAFGGSIARLEQLPADGGREVAFAGRSNAGKSSVLNAITGRKNLAYTSKTPGRTQLINRFDLGPDQRLIDLPGYGYAKVPEATRRNWERLLGDYLRQRRALMGVVVVLDARRGVTELDWQLLGLLGPRSLAVHAVLTKADKLKRATAKQALAHAHAALESGGVEATLQLFSATKRDGITDLHSVLDDWLGFGGDIALTRGT